jgi:soluble lytic murein transglycosylase
MPEVPTYQTYQVNQNALPAARIQDGVSMEGMTMASRQMEQQGQQQQRAGQTAMDSALRMQEYANDLRVDDAYNQIKIAAQRLTADPNEGYMNLRGVDALERPSKKALPDEYMEKLREQVSNIEGTLGNDAQKRLFRQKAESLATSFYGDTIQHQGSQFREYAASVREATISNELGDIMLNFDKPDKVSESVERIRAATLDLAKMQGKSAAWGEVKSRENISKAHRTVIEAAVERGNVGYAKQYMDSNIGNMSGDDIITTRVRLDKQYDATLGASIAASTVNSLSTRIDVPDAERAFNILLRSESGNRQTNDKGEPLVSEAGAIGISQVMPATAPEAARLAGVPFDDARYRNDEEYNKSLGRAYFTQQLRDFGGSLDKAYAAYNAGPGATKDAIQAAEKEGKSDWLQRLPKETQDYVRKNMAAFSSGAGRPVRPTVLELREQVRRQVGDDNPQRLKIALDEAERLFKLQNEAVKQREDEAVANAMRAVLENGGSYANLPPQIQGSIPPDKVATIMDYAKKVSDGGVVTDPALYGRLSDASELMRYSDTEFEALRAQLSGEDYKHFAAERGKLRSGQSGNGPGDLNSAAIKSVLDNRLAALGLDPTPKKATSGEAVRVGAIRRFVNQQVIQAQREHGKKFTDSETEQFIDGLISKTTAYKTFFGEETRPMLGAKVGDIQQDLKDNIRSSLKARGLSEPSDSDILNVYWTYLTRVQKQAGVQKP